jgi:coproporphyrinogen III oxidase-like Fe-S oxidoreductase
LPPKTLLQEYLIFHLRLVKGLSLQKAHKICRVDLVKVYKKQLAQLVALKLVKLTKTRLRVTTKGLYLLDEVLGVFM